MDFLTFGDSGDAVNMESALPQADDTLGNIRYNGEAGAMLSEISGGTARFSFVARDGEVIDRYTVQKNCS